MSTDGERDRRARERPRSARRPGAARGDPTGSSRADPTQRSSRFGRTLLLTVVGSVLPGTAFLAAGRRRLGASVLAVFVLIGAAAAWFVTQPRRDLLELAVDSDALGWAVGAISAVGVGWLVVIVTGYLSLRPRRLPAWQQGIGAVVVALLCAAVAVPASLAVRSATAQRALVDTVFSDDRRSATVEEPEDPVNPFGDDRRVNVLLLGGDGGEGRRGVRTDTVMVASIETATGATTLFSLPRNLQDVPFPADSPLAEVWPDGFDAGSESESLLNAIYRNGPRIAPDALGPTDNPGADMLKLAVGEALGLSIDYYVLLNLDGFVQLVDALGGITVNVNYYVPVGGEPTLGIRPDDYIAPGPDRHLNGTRALEFARGRFGMSDYDRMARQRCAVEAIVDAADPVTVLWEYRELAAAAGNLVRTDIPRSVLDDFVDLAVQVQDVDIDSVVFDDTVITPAYPDYDRIRALVQDALRPAPPPGVPSGPPSTPSAPPDAPPATPDGAADPVTDVADACAYDPARAEAALEAGEPPTRAG